MSKWFKKNKSWTPEPRETELHRIHKKIRRRRTIRQWIEIIVMGFLIWYMCRDLYRAGEFDFFLK